MVGSINRQQCMAGKQNKLDNAGPVWQGRSNILALRREESQLPAVRGFMRLPGLGIGQGILAWVCYRLNVIAKVLYNYIYR